MSVARPLLWILVAILLSACGWIAISALRGDRLPDRRGEVRGAGEVPAAPVRIVPVNASAVDFVCALVDPERIAALPRTSETYSTLVRDSAVLAGLPRFVEFTSESILMHRPDLVVAHPWQGMDTVRALREAGVPVLGLPEVTGLEQIYESIRMLERPLGAEERARELRAELERRVAALRERARAREPLAILTYTSFSGSGWTAGAGTSADTIIELVGCVNAAAEAGLSGHPRIGFETLLDIDPDAILVSTALRDDSRCPTRDMLIAESALADLAAVRAGRILALPARCFSTVSHEIVTSAELLMDALEALDRGD